MAVTGFYFENYFYFWKFNRFSSISLRDFLSRLTEIAYISLYMSERTYVVSISASVHIHNKKIWLEILWTKYSIFFFQSLKKNEKKITDILLFCLQVELVRWTESVGLTLVNRDLNTLQLKTQSGQILSFCILQIFPFTSESKRMGIIVRVRIIQLCHIQTCDSWLWFYLTPDPMYFLFPPISTGGVDRRNHILHEGCWRRHGEHRPVQRLAGRRGEGFLWMSLSPIRNHKPLPSFLVDSAGI